MKEIDFSLDNKDSESKFTFDIKRFIGSILRSWPWIILSVFTFLLCSWLYTRYLTNYYLTTSKIVVKDSKNSGTGELLRGVITSESRGDGIQNEIHVLKSSRIIEDVVNQLNLHILYFKEGKIIENEIYGNEVPYIIQVLSNPNNATFNFRLNVNNSSDVKILLDEQNSKETKIEKTFTIKDAVFKVIKNPNLLKENIPSIYDSRIEIRNPKSVAVSLSNLINISQTAYTSILNISMEYPNSKKSEAVLEQLIKSYNKDAIKDKNLEFNKTEEFIDERIAILNKELGDVENTKESFQSNNNLANLEAEIGMSISEKSNLEKELLNTEAQLTLVNSFKKYIEGQNIEQILPYDVSSSSGNSNSAISEYNQMVNARKNLLSNGATEQHPEVQNLTKNIIDTKKSIINNIEKQEDLLTQTKKGINRQLETASLLKSNAPFLQKKSRDIERQQGVKESLFLLLLQKREEAAISAAITQDKAKVIDPPISSGPVKPKKSNYYLIALALGLFLPIGLIYLKNILRNKIETRQDLELIAQGRPILGELPSLETAGDEIMVKNDISEVSEAFRILRTNAEFVISQTKENSNKGKVVLVTSSIKGEGKTFVSMNYAHALSQIDDKKVIIIGADIRNPQIHRYTTKNKNTSGLTEYLYQGDVNDLPVINKSSHDNKTDIIFSGKIPPNPTELLMNNKIPVMLDKLRELYDYIIIDSAPILMVSDTFNLTAYTDATIYVTRSNYTPREILKYPMEMYGKGRLKNISFVLNDVSKSTSGYGYSYGYGYGYNYGYGYGYHADSKKRTLFQKIKSSLFSK